MRRSGVFCSLIAGLVLVSTAPAGAGTSYPPFPPVDEGAKDSSFQRFRARLISAVQAHDASFVLSVVDRNIDYSFGERGGIAGFRKRWMLERKESTFWPTIGEVLRLGGSFIRDETFCAPYVYSLFPTYLDPVDYAAIIARTAPVRSHPREGATVIGRMSYTIVRVLAWIPGNNDRGVHRWAKVVTAGGHPGYVSGKHIRSPLDYRACFDRVAGRWVMTMFIAGD